MNTNQKIKELIKKYKFINKTSVDQIEYITLLAVICNLEALLEPCKHENTHVIKAEVGGLLREKRCSSCGKFLGIIK